MVALDGLVQDGPSLARTLDARGAPHTQQAEGGIAQRGGNLVEQRGLGASKASPSCSGQVVASAVRASRASQRV